MESCSCDVSHIACTLGTSSRRVSAVCISMDEQLADARDAFALCHSTVGHISGENMFDCFVRLYFGDRSADCTWPPTIEDQLPLGS